MSRPKRELSERARLHLEVPMRVREQLERLRDTSGADSITEVVRRSLAVYEAMLTASRDGRVVIVRDKDGTERELLLVV